MEIPLQLDRALKLGTFYAIPAVFWVSVEIPLQLDRALKLVQHRHRYENNPRVEIPLQLDRALKRADSRAGAIDSKSVKIPLQLARALKPTGRDRGAGRNGDRRWRHLHGGATRSETVATARSVRIDLCGESRPCPLRGPSRVSRSRRLQAAFRENQDEEQRLPARCRRTPG